MIITKIRLQEENPMSNGTSTWPLPPCDLELNASAGENGYLIKNSVGLGPTQLTSVVVGFDTTGIPIMDSIAAQREIALRVQLVPKVGETPSSLRDDLYRFMSRSVLVSFMDESLLIASTSGYIRQFEALHFTNQPEVQMTVVCEDGYLTSPRTINIPLASLDTLEPVIVYEEGTAPTGFDIQFEVTANHATGFKFFNHAKGWHVGNVDVSNEFHVDYPLLIDDVVTISTTPKGRRISLLRAAVTYDLSGYINAGAVWPKLYSGVNTFEWDLSDTWMQINSASYVPRYWGV